jgi:hypothetical protein
MRFFVEKIDRLEIHAIDISRLYTLYKMDIAAPALRLCIMLAKSRRWAHCKERKYNIELRIKMFHAAV